MMVLILGGFLGSGKTTLLLQLIERVRSASDKEVPLAILENEIGSVGIDDALIASAGYQVSTMLSGCACCTLAGELPEAVMGIQRDLDPDLLVIEATGVAVPSVMAENLEKTMGIHPRVCVVVDASRWRRMQVPLKLADSKTTSTVSSTISLFSPPMMPARPTARVSSAMTSMLGVSLRTLPSRVVSSSPSWARRTTIFPPFT